MSYLQATVAASIIGGGLLALAFTHEPGQVSEESMVKIRASVICGNLYELAGDKVASDINLERSVELISKEADRLGIDAKEVVDQVFDGREPEQVSIDTRDSLDRAARSGIDMRMVYQDCDKLNSITRITAGSAV